jgi:hypothetical protein
LKPLKTVELPDAMGLKLPSKPPGAPGINGILGGGAPTKLPGGDAPPKRVCIDVGDMLGGGNGGGGLAVGGRLFSGIVIAGGYDGGEDMAAKSGKELGMN